MADVKSYNLASLDRSQLTYIRKLAKDGLATVTVSIEHRELDIPEAKEPKPRKSSK